MADSPFGSGYIPLPPVHRSGDPLILSGKDLDNKVVELREIEVAVLDAPRLHGGECNVGLDSKSHLEHQ